MSTVEDAPARERLVSELVLETTGQHRAVCLSAGAVCWSTTRTTAAYASSALQAHALQAHRSQLERRGELQHIHRERQQRRSELLGRPA